MTLASRFEGKTAIITGSASGIGRATLIRLVSEGATALGVDQDEAGLRETVSLANNAAGTGGQASFAVGSIADEAFVKSTVEAFAAKNGRLDVLVNLAGILRSTHLVDTTLEEFRHIIAVNLEGTFLFCRQALPHLLKTKGNIVNAASTSASFGHPYMAAYAASKGGIAAFTHTLAREFILQGVRVNAVAPGGIMTPMVAGQPARFPEGANLSLFSNLTRPDGHFGRPEAVAGVIAMLASEDGEFINGEIIRIDGGTHS
ncbi:MAG: SDR family oxidoreductase [Proteobacteria bacterium]|nr:SDR family oxidoreductase [Pseudomonadota bacterium]